MLTDGLTLPTLQGETIEFEIDGNVTATVTVNQEVISATDIVASNGVVSIGIIDTDLFWSRTLFV